MSFTSPEFLLFFTGLLLLYYLLPKKCQWMLLLAASCGFYLCGGVSAIGYLLFAVLTTYVAGRLLGVLNARLRALSPEEKKTRKKGIDRRKKAVVLVVCLLNFGLLFVLKYASFVLDAVGFSGVLGELVLPLGISFFIFQSVGYVVDCYRGKVTPQENFAKYALFVSFFPQLTQGPIGRYDALAPQLTAEHPLDWENLRSGLWLMLWGYLKKLVIAERTAPLVQKIFGAPDSFSGALLLVGVLGYCVQLYCDFSGGIDIVRGAAECLGIEMAENFRRPIFAKSLAEYWRRWHISLGGWMRDYVFYPLALSKPFRALGGFARKHFKGTLGKIFATSMATFVVYFLIGIWHGANFRYLAFGAYNGVLITAALLIEPFMVKVRARLPIRWDGTGWQLVQMLRTGLLVLVGRYITRAPRFLVAVRMLLRTVTELHPGSLLGGTLLGLGMSAADWIVVLCGLGVIFAVELYQERGGKMRQWVCSRSAPVQTALTLAMLLAVLFLGAFSQGYTGAGFIYAQY